MRIGARLYLLITITLLVLTTIIGITLSMLHSSIVQEKQDKLQNLVEIGLTTLDHYGKMAESGAMTQDAAQTVAKKAISAMRFEVSNYLFVVDTDHRMLIQPLKPELEGKDVSDVKDANGVRVLYELVNLARRDGWNYLEYLWPKSGKPDPVQKMSTAKLYAPWGWVIGAGIYIDDVNAAFWRAATTLGGVAAAAIVLLVIIAVMITRSIVRPLGEAVNAAEKMAAGDFDFTVQSAAKDEIGQLQGSIGKVQSSLQSLIVDVNRVSEAMVAGRLSARSETDKHLGDYRKLMDGMNAGLNRLVDCIEFMAIPVMAVDREFNIQYMNELGAKLGGKTSDQVVGTKCYDHFKTSDCRTDKCACGRAMGSGQTANSETDAHPGTHNLDIAYTGMPLHKQDGKVIGAFEFVIDETDWQIVSILGPLS